VWVGKRQEERGATTIGTKNDGKRRRRIVVVMYCCYYWLLLLLVVVVVVVTGMAWHTIKYERTTTKKYKLNPNWS